MKDIKTCRGLKKQILENLMNYEYKISYKSHRLGHF